MDKSCASAPLDIFSVLLVKLHQMIHELGQILQLGFDRAHLAPNARGHLEDHHVHVGIAPNEALDGGQRDERARHATNPSPTE